jgi:DNA-binding IclR family transcriptional regulator
MGCNCFPPKGVAVPEPETGPHDESRWSFLSNHALVLLCLTRNPAIRLRDVADHVGLTERAVQRIVADLESDEYLTRARTGRRNQYEVHLDLPLRHPNLCYRTVRELLAPFLHRDAESLPVRTTHVTASVDALPPKRGRS